MSLPLVPSYLLQPAPREVRTVLGPCRCQGCGGDVIYEMVGDVHVGWLHEDGRYVCGDVSTFEASGQPRSTQNAKRYRDR